MLPKEKSDLMRQRIKMLVKILDNDPQVRELVAKRAMLDNNKNQTLVLDAKNTANLLLDAISVEVPSSS